MGLKVKISIGYILLIFLLTTVILLFRGKEERKRRRTLEKEESELAGVRRLTAKVYMSLLDLSSHAEVVSIWTDDDFHNYCTRQDTVRKNLKALRHYVHTPEQQAGDPDQTYAYELSGRLVQASRGKARWSSHTTPWDFRSGKRPAATPYRTYDHTGRILTLDSTTGASLRYTRNGYGELEGFSVTDGSDADGAGSWESAHCHNTLGFEVERILPGGVVRSFTYDDIGRLVDARTRKDPRTRHMRRYRWGVADRLLSVEDSRRGETRYSYTPTGQLERAEYPGGREQWRKSDQTGNLYPAVADG